MVVLAFRSGLNKTLRITPQPPDWQVVRNLSHMAWSWCRKYLYVLVLCLETDGLLERQA